MATNSWYSWRFCIRKFSLLNLKSHQPDIDETYLYAEDPYKAKYQLLVNKRESTGSKHFNDSKAFNTRMIWMVFIKILKNTIQIKNEKYWSFLMIWLLDILSNNKLNPIVTELFFRGRKLNISLDFIIQFYLLWQKIHTTTLHCFIMKISNKGELE